MCEQFVARAAEPFRLDELWPFTERLERFGLAGFGWGAAWLGDDGGLHSHRDLRAFRDDPRARRASAPRATTAVLVHLRRPSRLSTLDLPDTQPFDDPAGRFASATTATCATGARSATRYRAEGGSTAAPTPRSARAGSRTPGATAARRPVCSRALHERFGGQANLAVLGADGTPHHYAGNTENPVFTFRLGRIGLASTGLYSLDRSLFRFAAPGATERRLVRIEAGDRALDRNGSPITRRRRMRRRAARDRREGRRVTGR